MNIDIEVTDNSAEVINAKDAAALRALTVIGDKCATYASMLAPVDTGRLKQSIDKKLVESEKAVYVGTNVEYAVYQELGTIKMKAANGGRGYLRPAVSEHMSEYQQIIKSEFAEIGASGNWNFKTKSK